MAPTVCLNMIVRDEAPVIWRCLRSVRPFITSWAIVDTGSTDDTREIVRHVLDGIPGEIVDREWTDFATARNQALDLARARGDAEWLMFIDADEVILAENGWPIVLGGERPPMEPATYYNVNVHYVGNTFQRTVLLRADSRATWRYPVHEALEPLGPNGALLPRMRYLSRLDGARRRLGDPRPHDIVTLRAALTSDPDNPELLRRLAQVLCAVGEETRNRSALEESVALCTRIVMTNTLARELCLSTFETALRVLRQTHGVVGAARWA